MSVAVIAAAAVGAWWALGRGRLAPLSRYRVSSPYGTRVHPVRGTRHFHGGLDMAAPIGTPIRASGPGRVVEVWVDRDGFEDGNGHAIGVAYDEGYYLGYAHLDAPTVLEVGDRVSRGSVLGVVGMTGTATGPHLHLTARVNGQTVDPSSVLPVRKA